MTTTTTVLSQPGYGAQMQPAFVAPAQPMVVNNSGQYQSGRAFSGVDCFNLGLIDCCVIDACAVDYCLLFLSILSIAGMIAGIVLVIVGSLIGSAALLGIGIALLVVGVIVGVLNCFCRPHLGSRGNSAATTIIV